MFPIFKKDTCEKMWELDGKDDGLLERLLGGFQARHVAPLDVGLLHHDRVVQLALHLLLLRVVVIRVSVRVCVEFLGLKTLYNVTRCAAVKIKRYTSATVEISLPKNMHP